MSIHFREIAEQAAADGAISAEEILELRRAGWADGKVQPEEAEAIFTLNASVTPSNEWSDFFVEAIGEYIVNQQEPRGYITSDQAVWLVDHVDHDGKVDSLTELELLVRVFEKAVDVPESLRFYALEQIERAVISGEGPTRCGGELEQNNVTEAEAKLLRRIIFSTGSERPAAVSKREAELLFRIKDATVNAVNAPEWKTLFAQGVGNYLAGYTAHTSVSRERMAELESFMADDSSSVGRFFGRMAKSTVNANRVGKVFGRKAPSVDQDALVAQAEQITPDEQAWLDERIAANGTVDEYDQALLDFLAGH